MGIRDEAFAGQPISVPIIDAHTHLLGYYYNGWYQAFNSHQAVIALMDHLGIDCIVTAPHALIAGDMALANRVADEAATAYPGRIYGYITICPQDGLPAVKAEVARYAGNRHFLGFKFLPGYHGPLACPEYDYALDFAAEAGCPVLSHIWGDAPALNEVERAAKQNPRLKLLMAHQGGGSAPMTEAYAALMRDYPNLFMELCGMLYNTCTMEEYVTLAGEDRVIYGSDMVNLDPRYDFGQVVLSPLPDEIKQKILAGNYLRLLEGSQLGRIEL